MTKRVPWDRIREIIHRFPEGTSLEEIMLGLGPQIPRRTLQRWLSQLVQRGDLVASGKTRARLYKAPFHQEPLKQVSSPIRLSKEGSLVLSQMSLPVESRPSAAYRRKFLEEYIPNRTFYLSQELQSKLLQMGKSEEKEPMAGTYARSVFRRLLIDLSWNSSRLEGNTYSLLETERLLETGKAAEGKNILETQMILNHKAAIEFLIDASEEVGINRYTVLNLHTLLSDNLMPDPAACGRLRTIPMGIAKSVYQPSPFPQVVEEGFDAILTKAREIENPFEQSFFLMVHLPYLQAFDDVNKRTSRLAANIPLIQKNLCPLSFIDVPEDLYIQGLLGIYELNCVDLLRDIFVWAYERSSLLYSTARKSMGEPDLFRLQYRSEIQHIVKKIVLGTMSKMQAIQALRQWALQAIQEKDQPRFIEIVERELQSLHLGNIARYQVRPLEYKAWQKCWD